MPFKVTENTHSAVPFWFWNGEVDEKEISRQMAFAKAGNYRGVAIHARIGNRTPYLSDRWMELVEHACQEADRLGLEIWTYDEEDYPSGRVGGRLPAKGRFYQQKTLEFVRTTAARAAAEPDLFAVFPESNLTHVVDPASLPPKTPVLAFICRINEHRIDYLKREVCEEFLNMTHRKYEKALGHRFGKTITTVFTDDLNHMLRYAEPELSCTDSLFGAFEKEYGYSLKDHLPDLVENLPGCMKTRMDYRNILVKLFRENFVRPLRNWCAEHNLTLTGHLSGDEGPIDLEVQNYTDPFDFYAAEDIPGVDDFLCGDHALNYLGEAFNTLPSLCNGQTGFAMIPLCKKASSVASQLKGGRCSSEVLTSLGWGVPVATLIGQIQVQLALGVNVIVPHAIFYTTANLTKRDHPQSCFFQEPWYRFNADCQRAVNRSMNILSRGRVLADTLVIHPIRSLWLMMDGADVGHEYKNCIARRPDYGGRTMRSYTDLVGELSLKLTQMHVAFEFGGENILLEHGKIEGAVFRVGAAAYSTVILPDLLGIEPSTRALLDEFSRNGGKIVVIGHFPEFVGGEPVAGWNWQNVIHIADVAELPLAELNPQLKMKRGSEILVNTRVTDTGIEYFLVNFGEKKADVSIDMPNYEVYDPLDDTLSPAQGTIRLEKLHSAHLLPRGTVDAPHVPLAQSRFSSMKYTSKSLAASWHISPEDPNVYLIDRGRNDRGDIIAFEWTGSELRPGEQYTGTFELPEVSADAALFFEADDISDLKLNGVPICGAPSVSHPATQALAGYAVAPLLRKGGNTITFRNNRSQIEVLYLTGSFGVDLRGDHAEIFSAPELGFGDLSQQGYPFYWGNFRYETTFDAPDCNEKTLLALPGCTDVVSIEINGIALRAEFMAPYRFAVGPFLKKKDNRLTIRVANTAQNFFGPHRKISLAHRKITAWAPEIRGNDPMTLAVASFGLPQEPVLLIP